MGIFSSSKNFKVESKTKSGCCHTSVMENVDSMAKKFQVNIKLQKYCKKYCENIAKFQVNRWERDGLREPWGSQEVLRFQNQLLLLFSRHQLLQPLHLRPLDPRSKRASKSDPSSLQ